MGGRVESGEWRVEGEGERRGKERREMINDDWREDGQGG